MAVIKVYTDGGTRPTNPGFSGAGSYLIIGKSEEVRMVSYMGDGQTNNRAEAKALLDALEFLKERSGDRIQIFTDSKCTIQGTTGSNPEPANADLILECRKLFNAVKAKARSCTINWVKGHNGDPGNEEADRLATLGVELTRKGTMGKSTYTTSLVKGTSELTEGVDNPAIPPVVDLTPKVKEPKVAPINPLLSGRALYFRSGAPLKATDGRHAYCTVTFDRGTDKENNKLGKFSPDSHYAVSLLKEKVTVVNKFSALYDRLGESYQQPILVELEKVKSGKLWSPINRDFDAVTNFDKQKVFTENNDMLAEELMPPKLFFLAEKRFEFCYDKIKQYLDKDTSLTVTDITESLIETNDKGKQILKADFNQTTRAVKLKDISLSVGIDLPKRNNVSAMLKIYKDSPVKISLVKWTEDTKGYYFGVMIEAGEDISFCYSHVAGYRLTIKK